LERRDLDVVEVAGVGEVDGEERAANESQRKSHLIVARWLSVSSEVRGLLVNLGHNRAEQGGCGGDEGGGGSEVVASQKIGRKLEKSNDDSRSNRVPCGGKGGKAVLSIEVGDNYEKTGFGRRSYGKSWG